MFREIRTSEKITDLDERNEAFRNIKPEVEMTFEELKKCIKMELEKAKMERELEIKRIKVD